MRTTIHGINHSAAAWTKLQYSFTNHESLHNDSQNIYMHITLHSSPVSRQFILFDSGFSPKIAAINSHSAFLSTLGALSY